MTAITKVVSFSPKQLHSLTYFIACSQALRRELSPGGSLRPNCHMMEKTPQAGTQGKIACFCYFDVRVEKEEMWNPIKIKNALHCFPDSHFWARISYSPWCFWVRKKDQGTHRWVTLELCSCPRWCKHCHWGCKQKGPEKETTLPYWVKPQAPQGNSWFPRLKRKICNPQVYHPFNSGQRVTPSNF